MTDDQINTAIAEKCGWTNIHHVAYETWHDDSGTLSGTIGKSPDKQAWPELQIPNFANDLNAMHEAESVIGTSADWTNKYMKILWYIGSMKGIHATSHQRAEAFLRVFNLWTD